MGGGTATEDLLEREAELTATAAAVRDAVAGNGRLLLIEGEPGIGKTVLLGAIRRRGRRGRAHDAGRAGR